MNQRLPPRFVPTLTEVVQPAQLHAPSGPVALSQDELVRRVMQRVDQSLEQKLREAVAATVLEHTRTMGPVPRQPIESVVRDTVSQAFDQALDAQRQHHP